MADIVDRETRSRMMAGIKGKNTKPEMTLRRALHASGFRYRIHAAAVPGKPDLVFPRYHAAVFVNGCFWHGHDCKYFRLPQTRAEFWAKKISDNKERDVRVILKLEQAGWHHMTVWECSLRGEGRAETVAREVAGWLGSLDGRRRQVA